MVIRPDEQDKFWHLFGCFNFLLLVTETLWSDGNVPDGKDLIHPIIRNKITADASSSNPLRHTNHSTALTHSLWIPQRQNLQQPSFQTIDEQNSRIIRGD